MAPESATGGNVKTGRGFIDTAAPFESVKAAVSMFGGIVDWKAHKAQTLERHKQVQIDLDKAQEEITHYKRQSEAAKHEKALVLNELDTTKKQIEELKLSLEKAETAEAQAKQDLELALLRLNEMQQGIAGEASVASQAELDIAKARHASVVAELKSIRIELDTTQSEYTSLLEERDLAVKNADEAVSKSADIEKKLEDLTLDLIAAKETLESAHAAHMEAEEYRLSVVMAKEEDSVDWEKELRQAEDEAQRLKERILAMKDLQTKVDTATAMLAGLRSELSSYMDAKLNESKSATALSETERELEEVKLKIEKAREDVKCLHVTTASLKAELAGEEAIIASLKEREGERPDEVSSLEFELSRVELEIELLREKESEARRQMEELPQSLQQAAREAEEAKSAASLANEELLIAKEESEQVRAAAIAAESRLRAALKEIEAAKASERLAFDAIKALEESEQAESTNPDDSLSCMTIPLGEYYTLSKNAHDAEDQANDKVAEAMSLVEEANKSEERSLERLAEAARRLEERRETLRQVTEKADIANEGKLAVEQELREWRAVKEQRRKAGDDGSKDVFNPSKGPRKSFDDGTESRSMMMQQELGATVRRAQSAKMDVPDGGRVSEPKKKKKSFFPRIVMFLARKKAHSAK